MKTEYGWYEKVQEEIFNCKKDNNVLNKIKVSKEIFSLLKNESEKYIQPILQPDFVDNITFEKEYWFSKVKIEVDKSLSKNQFKLIYGTEEE